jgi:formamidopyrimidine-DNA glycosylase
LNRIVAFSSNALYFNSVSLSDTNEIQFPLTQIWHLPQNLTKNPPVAGSKLMPELPEVETMRRGIASIQGGTIVSASRTACSKRPIAITPRIDHLNKRIAGQTILRIDRLGKRVVVVTEKEDRLIFEPRMTGLVLISHPPSTEHLRFRLELTNCPVPELLFWDRRGLGNVCCLSHTQYQQKLLSGKLGPDAMAITPQQFRDRFRSSRREVKVALLDQSAVAGIGNLYASEILHLAGIHPQVKCNRLSDPKWHRIHHHMIEVLTLAIEYEGSTLSDGTYRNALNKSGGYQNQHRVYDRAGQQCPSCRRSDIVRIVQCQRSTFFCKRCQKKR